MFSGESCSQNNSFVKCHARSRFSARQRYRATRSLGLFRRHRPAESRCVIVDNATRAVDVRGFGGRFQNDDHRKPKHRVDVHVRRVHDRGSRRTPRRRSGLAGQSQVQVSHRVHDRSGRSARGRDGPFRRRIQRRQESGR